ncbi:MAG TPA: hypothetical protein VMW19_10605 [Myxococcota bacterium]|nr:hypothetical protein [Myxococcota bacterium]
MGKVFGILLIVIAIWLGLQYFTAEAPAPTRDPERAAQSPAQRVGQRVSDALASGAAREEKLAPE